MTTDVNVWTVRWASLRRLAWQEFRDTLLGWGGYLTVGAGMLLAVVFVYNSVRFVAGSGLEILGRPFLSPLFAAVSFVLLYVTVVAAMAIARPREQGALQVLFFAPVDAFVLVGAHLLAGISVYTVLVALLVPLLELLAMITNVHLPPALLWGLLPTIPIAALAVSFGLSLSAVAQSSRSAVLLLVGASIVVLSVQGSHAALLNVPPTSKYYDALLFLRVLLRNINVTLGWISPFGMLTHSLDAGLRADWGMALQVIGRALAGTLVWATLAVALVRRRGVLP